MLNKLEKAKSSWGGRSETIDKWLQERQSLLIKYCDLAGLNQPDASKLPTANDVSDFCAVLMDYISAGHFEVYEMLVSDDEAGIQLKRTVYPQIAQTTDNALRFNDHFAEALSAEQAKNFDSELADLGNVLEERFALEDRLIHHMHQKTKSDNTLTSA
ncbi:sigma D regulator [Alteromonas sp. ASW11-130]|uniref:sigma D regulator n=1 Tax=Alteromonas sp. ASW11-130 TaxID=3015775 RepID=UPI002242A132|nr:sigma D regulator [Alteromonas sp. ASW11-130]MCW8090781.1 sigma D regulator [Alteromonas sp. ASW11-130]